MWPQPEHPKSTAVETEKSPVDLLQAKQQNVKDDKPTGITCVNVDGRRLKEYPC